MSRRASSDRAGPAADGAPGAARTRPKHATGPLGALTPAAISVDPRLLSPKLVLHLQATAGNQAVQRLITSALQTSRVQRDETETETVEPEKGEEPTTVKQADAPAGTVEQVAENADAATDDWLSSDDTLWGILKGPFESNWFKARESLTMDRWPEVVAKDTYPKHETGLRLMNGLVDMRWRRWVPFAEKTLEGMKQQVGKIADTPAMAGVKDRLEEQSAATPDKDQAKIFNPVGSQAVTSDVDLSMGGKNSEIAVGFINQEFRKAFDTPYDPGTVFDINVYASDWIHGADETGDKEKIATPNPEVRGMSETARSERDDQMEVWSLVKARRNMETTEWDSYTGQMLAGLDDPDARKQVQKKLASADFEYQKFRANVNVRMLGIQAAVEEQEKKLHASRASVYAAAYQESARETRASNELYEELLLEVKALRLRLAKLDPVKDAAAIDNLGKQLGSKIAEALTYANEVYATEGAVQHTVLEQGKGKKLKDRKDKGEDITSLEYKLRPELFLQSVNENVGDSLHSLHAYHDLPRYSVYRAGKYISRLTEAAEKAGVDVSQVPHFETLKTIGSQAMAIKSEKTKVGDRELEGDPRVVERSDFFKGLDVTESGIEKLKAMIIAFGAKVPALFHSARAKQSEQPPAPDDETPEKADVSVPKQAPPATPPEPTIESMIAELEKIMDEADSRASKL